MIEIFVEWKTQKQLRFFGFQSMQRHISFFRSAELCWNKNQIAPISLFHQDHDKSVAGNWNLNLASRIWFSSKTKVVSKCARHPHSSCGYIMCNAFHYKQSTIIHLHFQVILVLNSSIFSVDDVWHGNPTCHIIWELLFNSWKRCSIRRMKFRAANTPTKF